MNSPKMITPGIHELAIRMTWEGEIEKPLSVEQARQIAEKVCHIEGVEAQMIAIKDAIRSA